MFFKIFNDYSSDFTEEFWKEVLHQIVLPVLEDIHLAVEIPNKNTDSEFYRVTINEILVKMNAFLVNKIDAYKHLIPTYIEVLSIFISTINEVSSYTLL